jgi:hypothetical protein
MLMYAMCTAPREFALAPMPSAAATAERGMETGIMQMDGGAGTYADVC